MIKALMYGLTAGILGYILTITAQVIAGSMLIQQHYPLCESQVVNDIAFNSWKAAYFGLIILLLTGCLVVKVTKTIIKH